MKSYFGLVGAFLFALTASAGMWEGKRVSILGDSYSTFAGISGDPANDSLPAGDSAGCKEFENNPFYPGDVSIQDSETWWRQVLASLGGTLERNNSVGGSEITRDVGSEANIPKDGRNLIRSFIHRAANGALGNPDVILVLGGTNDGWDGLGQSEFKNGVKTLFAALKSLYPNAQVIVIVPAQANDSAGIAGISADLRTVLLNGAAGSGFLSVDLNGVGFASDDFRLGHPKASGMTKIANKVIATVNAAPTFYKTLETDGRGYILTDYQPKTSRSRIEYDLRFLYLGLSVGLGIANGTSSSGAANTYEWGGYFNAENRIFTYYTEPGGAGMSFGAGFCDTSVRHTIAMGQGAVALDDQVTAIPTPADDYTTGGKFALFAVNYGGTTFSARANVRVAGIRIFEGDTVVRSWVPAKDVNGTATLYDLVNRKFETVKAGVFSVDDTVDPTWEAQAANSWTVQPSVPSSVTAGTLPTISLGTAKYGNGTQTATYTAKDIQNLPAGTYTQVVEVKGTAGYQGLRQELTFTVTGTVPTAASVAPTAVAPLGGASVATHTAKQKEFIGLPYEVRKRVLSVHYERERAEYAANDGHPQPVRLQWNGGDGECTVKVYRGEETTPVQTHTVVTRWTDGNFLDVDNLEVGRAYRWTVTNGKGTAEGSFVTEGETPRLLNAGVVGNTRDLGGYVGLDGRRVRQGMFLRSRCFDTNKKATYASILTATEEAFFRDFIGLKTEIDLRGDTWITQSFVPGVTTRVNTAWPLDYTGSYLTDAAKKSAMKAALNPIFDAAKYPIDVHCHSGQDRTGMYCFILEALLGVSEEDCIRDWEYSALGNSGFNASDVYQLNSFLAEFRSLSGATTQAKAETFMKWLGYSPTLIGAFREIMLEPVEEPVEPTHEHTVENVPAVAATYATPGRTAGTRCSDCGEILSGCEAVPVLTSAITLSATVAADGQATVTLGNVQAPVVLSVVYGNEDRGGEYYRDADWDGGEDPIGWDDWLVVGYLPAGTTTKTCTIPNWGVDAADGRNGAKFARFILTAAEQTLKCAYGTATGTNPATQFIDTGIVPTGDMSLIVPLTLKVDPKSKVLADTPSSTGGALAYGISFDASGHPVYNYGASSYAVSGATASSGKAVSSYMNNAAYAKDGKWRCKVGDSKYYTDAVPAASALTTDGTLRLYGLGELGNITFGRGGETFAYFTPAVGFAADGSELTGFFETRSGKMFTSAGGAAFTLGEPSTNYRKDLMSSIPLRAETATIEYAVPPPPDPTVAPGGLAPDGVTVALHTDRQKAFLALSRDERRANYTDQDWRAELAEGSGAPKPVTLAWTGDGECTVTVVRAKDRKAVFTATLVGNAVDVWNLEINTAYEWTVVNALGTAKGTFTTEDEAPRLLRDPLATATSGIRGIRDLGGRVGLGGRRVRQGRVFRCSQLNKDVSFVTDANRGLYLDELGIKTDLDFRSGDELYGITSSPLGPSVRWVNAQIGSYEGLFGSATGFKKTFDTFLDEANYPIVFHCAAGRDRTGVVAFLLNALLGVDEEELIKDWEANAFWNADVSFCHANLDTFYTTLATKANGGETVQEQAVNAVLNMGYTMADVAKFRSLMLEPAEEPGAMPAALVISEVCARCQPKAVPACKDLGWIEFYNGSNETVNLRDYKLLVLNRGKKIDAAKNILPLADCEIAPGGYALVYTSESFGNAAVAEVEDTFAGRGTITVYPKKINQKKYPFVQLFRGDELVQTVVVPVDLADEKSYTTVPERRILATPTPGAANGTEGVAYGPNISSLYGVKDAPDPWRAFPKAQVGEDYEVSFPVNPADMSTDAEDEIICVRLLYRIGFGETVEGPVMTKAAAADAMNGWVYTGTIPGAAFAKAGELVRFAALITDGKGRTWRSPSFCNPDDGYEWYGTIVAPGTAAGEGAESANLQTFHLFADPDEVADTPGEMNVTALMNLDADNPNFVTEEHPYGARVGVYDSTTGLYYDHVRIDLRGHTSAGFVKKSHGLRFNKSQPLSCTDPVTGTVVEEIRKSSFVSEYPDVSGVRQMLAFKIFNENGSPAPFHYPVRLNLNGRFYQLAYHSERFTDELIEDCYGFDPLGYSYKNVGTFADGNVLKIEKKTPDDDHEDDLAVLKAFEATLQLANSRTVVKSFDLPAWINYVALERITGERDGLCANTSAFYDINGTDTWRPLAYDMNMSFGVYNTGIWQDNPAMKDWSKARGLDPTAEHLHPFAGGLMIGDDGNLAVENVFQSAKFRRLYLRRLRTLMDKVLKAPDTALADTPAFQWAKGVADRIADDAALDRALWMDTADKIATGSANWVWGDRHTEAWTVAEGWTDLWDNYVVPRRDYLFNEQTATPAGYAANLPAGIPAAQKPTAELKAGFAFANADVGTTLVISNGNAEAVDMSGWTLTGKVAWTIPAGTVIDANDVLTVVADRRAYVAAHEAELGEQMIVGNAAFDPSVASLVLADDAGSEVVEVGVPPTLDVGEATATPGTDFVGATVVLELGPQFSDHGNPVVVTLAVNGGTVEGKVDLDAKTVTFEVETAERGETYAGEVTLMVGEEQLERSVTLEQGRRTVIDASDGWIRVGETEVADSMLVTPETPAPETAQVVLKARLELGAGAEEGTFDAADQVGVMAVTTQGGTAYLFKTAEGVVTNVAASAEPGAETEVEILADYARRTVRYVIGGETNGPFALPAGAQRANAVNLGGSGNLKYLNGDYEIMGLNTNLAASGGAEYATVAEAVAAGGPVTLLWDASWTPTEDGDYSFVSNGHELKIGGDLAFEVRRNEDGTLSVTVGGTVEEPKPTVIALEDGKVVIGVANPDPKSSYVLARAARLGDEFVPDESTLKTGAELLSGASLEALVTPGVTSEFFKIVIKGRSSK